MLNLLLSLLLLLLLLLFYFDLMKGIKDLPKWVKPERVSTDLLNKFTKCEIRKDPLGVILIIGTWNYPLLSSLMPLIGAIAAG